MSSALSAIPCADGNSNSSLPGADSLFCLAAWVSAPLDVYMAWLKARSIAGRPYSAKTIEQYGTMLGAFWRWHQDRSDRSLVEITSADLIAFTESLAGRKTGQASIRTRRIYLMEISRVLEFLQSQGWRDDNPARDLVRELKRQEPMKFRNTALVGLPVRAHYLRMLDGMDASRLPWDEVRLHAMAVLMMEMGLTLKEVQKLTLHDIEGLAFGTLHAPGHRTLKRRALNTTPVVQHWLRAWMERRASCAVFPARARRRKGCAGEVLERTPENMVKSPMVARVFVSLLSSRSSPDKNGMRPAINRIDDRSIRQAANTALQMAAPNWPDGIVHGPQMLRNLCFQRWVGAHPENEELVASMMGLSDVQQVRWMSKLMGHTTALAPGYAISSPLNV